MDILDFLEHYGTPRHSGRYPWGSGKNPQRNRNFLQRADELAAQGLSKKEIAEAFGLSTGDYVAMRKIYKNQIRAEDQATAIKLDDKGWSHTAIAEKLGVSEGTVRNMLDPTKKRREDTVANIANELKEVLKEKPYLDIGEGTNRQLNISEEQLHAARLLLEDEGYNVYSVRIPQVSNPKQFTNMKVLCDGDVSKSELIKDHLGQITSPDGIYFENYGELSIVKRPGPSVDSSRVMVNYTETGGSKKDGVIELRPGVEDLTLGGRRYAQVRIGVDGTHYLKGMAIYGDPKDMPPGVDIVFNTNKHQGTPMLGTGDNTVLKEMKTTKDASGKKVIDEGNPFGAVYRPWNYKDAAGNEKPSPINIVNDDEDWDGWKKNLSSQFLSKQLPALAKRQLDIRYGEYLDEFDELKSLTNPTLKRQLCEDFADTCDAAAVHLKAAALPRQGSFAILPVTSLKDNEVYAPMYDNGEEVVLVRHPHAGTFEIPRLTVNNNNQEGIKAIGKQAPHAIGINPNVAQQLSGADYDGDTVLVIPTKNQKIKTSEQLDSLKNFNPADLYSRDPNDPQRTGKTTYKADGSIDKRGDGFNKGVEMGKVSNLITDMQIRGASIEEIERAVKHSMVVIDAEKHNYNWQKSELDNDIAKLRLDYQGKEGGGASTLISRSKGTDRTVPERKEVYSTSRMTPEELERYNAGEIIYRNTNRTYPEEKKITDRSKMTPEEQARFDSGKDVYRKTGKIKEATTTLTNMELAKDAYELSSGSYIESVYADYANSMKALANEARKEARNTGRLQQNKSAKDTYSDVVGKEGSLTKKIVLAELEAPKERQAQLIASSVMKAREQADPSLKEKDNADKRRKLANKALESARDQVRGGTHEKRYRIELSDREWDAIQAGAISDNQLQKILRYADTEEVKKRALPRNNTGMKASTKARARMLLNAGHTVAEVAKELGVSPTTLAKEFDNFKEMGGD
ncbi:MAG: helix-turn-helix domain-containing protein [Clostridiales bacterium]|nr:helix-turn-helix domain-containing protein [Clostridiales bacterium]